MEVVPLQPKTCKRCNIVKIRMDFAKGSNICRVCHREKYPQIKSTNSKKYKWCHNFWVDRKREVDRI